MNALPPTPASPEVPPMSPWNVQALWELLRPELPELSIEVVDQIDSTNQALVQRLHTAVRQAQGRGLRAQDLAPCLLVAQRQTAGRGRLGRSWMSRQGASLTFSLVLPLTRTDWSGLSLAVGLAVAQAFDPQASQIGLKWPNDVWLLDGPGQGRKLGGILIEALSAGGQRMAVIGIGLNVLPLRMAGAVAALNELLPDISAPLALHRLMPVLAHTLKAFDAHGFAPMVADYARYDLLLNQPVSTSDANCPHGVAQGVADDGALCVRQGEQLLRIISGEVSVRPGTMPLPQVD
jgi:BirA family biotin operon repressor/biotin-[acetyl-CoA-carboxylase] ligase